MFFAQVVKLLLGSTVAIFTWTAAIAQTPTESQRQISTDEISVVADWFSKNFSLSYRTREELCANLPPEASFSPNAAEFKGIRYGRDFQKHALLWSLKRSCESGRFQIGTPNCDKQEFIGIYGSETILLNRVLSLWSGENVWLRCLEGSLVIDGWVGLDLDIRDVAFKEFSVRNSKFRNFSLSNPSVGEAIDGLVGIQNSEISGNAGFLGNRIGGVYLGNSKIGGDFHVNYEELLGFRSNNAEIGGDLRIYGKSSSETFSPRFSGGQRVVLENTRVRGMINVVSLGLYSQTKGLSVELSNSTGRLLKLDTCRVDSIAISNSRFAELKAEDNEVPLFLVSFSEIDRFDMRNGVVIRPDRRSPGYQTAKPEIRIVDSIFGDMFGSLDNLHSFGCYNCQFKSNLTWRGTVGSQFAAPQARVSNGIQLQDLQFPAGALVDLSQVQARFLIMNPSVARASLRNEEPRPIQLRLTGAKFDFISGSPPTSAQKKRDNGLLALPSEELISLITPAGDDEVFDPQPFTMLAKMLTDAGYRDTASDLHVERIWRQLTGSEKLLNKIKGWIGYPIGYGYKPDPVLGVLVLLIVIGTAFSWWMLSEQRRRNIRSWKGKPLYIRAWKHLTFFVSDFFVSIVHLVPSVFGSWSATSLPKTKKKTGKEASRIRYGQNYFKFHTVLGSLLIFLLLTPATGIFD